MSQIYPPIKRLMLTLGSRRAQQPLTSLASTIARVQLELWGARFGQGLRVKGRLRLHVEGELVIGANVRMSSGYWNFVGGEKCMALWVCSDGRVEIGNGCALSNTTIVSQTEVKILDGTFVGGGCRIYDLDFHQLEPQARIENLGPIASLPIRIGPRAFVGGHATILKGVTIGEGAVIGAASVVTRDVPDFEIWAGVPACRIGNVGAMAQSDIRSRQP